MRDRLVELTPIPPGAYAVDEQTWRDLGMNSVVAALDRSRTPLGAQTLHVWMRRPLLTEASVAERRALLDALGDRRVGDDIAAVLAPLDRAGTAHLGDLLWREPPRPGVPWWTFSVLGLAVTVSVALAALTPWGWIATCALFLTAIVVHFHYERRIAELLLATAALGRAISRAPRVADAIAAAAPALADRLRVLASGKRAILRRAAVLRAGDPLGIVDHLKAAVVADVRAFFSLCRLIDAHRRDLRELIELLGAIDAARAVAVLRAERDDWSIPQRGPGGRVVAEDMRHPALEGAVGNAVALGPKGLLVTGANMSGKSTYLRAIGVNAILAQSIDTVYAARWVAPPLRVMSSIEISDDLATGTSYYKAEMESILRLVDSAGGAAEPLYLIDELFRGTNRDERVAAGAAILHFLVRRGLVVVATHDTEIAELVAEDFELGHFRESEPSADQFDFTLRAGLCRTSNAIDLLGAVGYPAAIVERARSLFEARLTSSSSGAR